MEKQNNQNNNSIDYRELVDFLVGQFDKIHQTLATKADKADLDKKADKSDIDRILTRIAMINTKIDDYRAEQIATQRQVDKHEKILCKP